MLSESTLKDTARLCWTNSKRLSADASLLFDEAHWPSSVALAIIAMEELGKALLCLLGALGVVPGLGEVLSGGRSPLRVHIQKQVLQKMVSVGADLTDEYVSILFHEAGEGVPLSAVDWSVELLTALIEDPSVLPMVFNAKEAKSYFSNLKDRGIDTDEELKWEGLYVDISPAGCNAPGASETTARLLIVQLESEHSSLAKLEESCATDVAYEQLKRLLVQRLHRSRRYVGPSD